MRGCTRFKTVRHCCRGRTTIIGSSFSIWILLRVAFLGPRWLSCAANSCVAHLSMHLQLLLHLLTTFVGCVSVCARSMYNSHPAPAHECQCQASIRSVLVNTDNHARRRRLLVCTCFPSSSSCWTCSRIRRISASSFSSIMPLSSPPLVPLMAAGAEPFSCRESSRPSNWTGATAAMHSRERVDHRTLHGSRPPSTST